jgi:hypothetical protein
MLKRYLVLGALTSALATPAAQDARTVIGSVKGSGPDTLKTVQYSATGFDYAPGQNPNANIAW